MKTTMWVAVAMVEAGEDTGQAAIVGVLAVHAGVAAAEFEVVGSATVAADTVDWPAED